MISKLDKLKADAGKLRDQILRLQKEEDAALIDRIRTGFRYFELSSLTMSSRLEITEFLCITSVEETATGYNFRGITVWPKLPRVEFGQISWTVAGIRSAVEGRNGRAVGAEEFDAVFHSTVGAIEETYLNVAIKPLKRNKNEG